MNDELRVIISGGGTGGHIFPAVSIANAIKAMHPDAKILFVGALGRTIGELETHGVPVGEKKDISEFQEVKVLVV